MTRTYTAELQSGFSLSISAKNLTEAKALADRAARDNDRVISVKWDRPADILETIKFRISSGTESVIGEAVVAKSFNEGTIYAENNLPGEVGTLKTNKIGTVDGYDIYENYYDPGSVDYSYFAVKVNR